MPRADAYYYITDPTELAQLRDETAHGRSLAAAAHRVVHARSEPAPAPPPTAPTPDVVDDHPWSKDECMDLDGTRWAARWIEGVVVLTRSPASVGLWA